MKIRTKKTTACHCLDCGKVLDAATSIKGKRPRPQDLTVCVHCGHIMVFAKDLSLRALTDDEMREVAGRPDILLLQEMRTKINWTK